VLASILGDGRASILNQYVRDEKGLITNGSASHQAFLDLGYFEIDVETSKPLEAQIAVLAELENIKKFGVTNEAVGRAKASIAQTYYHQLETVQGVGDNLGFYEALGDWKKSDGYIAAIQKVTPADVLRVAKQYMNTDQVSVFEYLPESETRTSNVDDYRQLVIAKVQAATEDRSVIELPVTAEIPPTRTLYFTTSSNRFRDGPFCEVPMSTFWKTIACHSFLLGFSIRAGGSTSPTRTRVLPSSCFARRSAERSVSIRPISRDVSKMREPGCRLSMSPISSGTFLTESAGRWIRPSRSSWTFCSSPLFSRTTLTGRRCFNPLASSNSAKTTTPTRSASSCVRCSHSYARTAIGNDASLQPITHEDLMLVQDNQRRWWLIIIDGDTNARLWSHQSLTH
jgi:hypothetical protein